MKKVISIVLAISLVSFLMQAYGENNSSISYDKAKTAMLSNNRTIKKLRTEERKAFLNYSLLFRNTKDLRTDGMTYKYKGKEYFFSFDEDTKLDLTIMKEYSTEEVKYYWETTGRNKLAAENSLAFGLRDLYLGLVKADNDLNICKSKFELAKRKYSISQLKFDQGLISRQDLDQSQYELLKAEKGVDEVSRNRENTVRSLNTYLGIDIATEYDTVEFDELKRGIYLKSLEDYVKKALNERLEVKNIEEEIRLKKLKADIITKSKLYGHKYSVNDQYKDLELEIESLEVKLKKTRFDIENEIKKAYIEIKNDLNDLESTSETLKMQTRTLEKLKSQYESGKINKIVVDEYEIGIEELKTARDLVIYNYNTKIMKIEELAGLGIMKM